MDSTGFEPTGVSGVQIGILETEKTSERAGIGKRLPEDFTLGHDEAERPRTFRRRREADDRCCPGLQGIRERRAATVDACEVRVASHDRLAVFPSDEIGRAS